MTNFNYNNKSNPQMPSINPRFFGTGIFGIVVLLLLAGALMNSWYTIDQGDRGVLLTNGAISTVVEPGLHFKLPFLQKVEKISLRQQVVKWGCETNDRNNTGGCGNLPAMQSYSRDQQPADMRVTVNYPCARKRSCGGLYQLWNN